MTLRGITWRLVLGTAVFGPTSALAQPPGSPDDGPPPRPGRGEDEGGRRRPGPPIMAALDANHDGELSPEEIRNASAALTALDHNHDGVLDHSEIGPPGGGPGGPPGAEGFGGPPDGPPPGGPDGPPDDGPPPGRGAGPGRPGIGNVLPPFVREGLSLSDKQQKQIAELEKTVKGKLESILSARQIRQVRALFERGPGGRGPGGPGGPPGADDGGPPTRPRRPDNN